MNSKNGRGKFFPEKFFGRRSGPALRPRQAKLLTELLPAVKCPIKAPALKNPLSLFGEACTQVWLEIGFGAGEHLAWQAQHHPQIGMIGAEPFINGVAKMLVQVDELGLRNVRIIDRDVRPLLPLFGEQSMSRAFLLFPDPWPKARHHKRRFVNQANLGHIHRMLKPGSELRFASDVNDYVCWTLTEVRNHGGFEWQARGPTDWRQRPADWPHTRYEAKAIRSGRTCTYLTFRRT